MDSSAPTLLHHLYQHFQYKEKDWKILTILLNAGANPHYLLNGKNLVWVVFKESNHDKISQVFKNSEFLQSRVDLLAINLKNQDPKFLSYAYTCKGLKCSWKVKKSDKSNMLWNLSEAYLTDLKG